MDILTSAADAILNDKTEILTPIKDGTRPIFKDLTNSRHVATVSPSHLTSSSLNSLLNEEINTKNHILPNLKTPRKRRKNSCKYGDENQAPSPKTPKNEQKFEFADSPVTPLSNLKMLTRIASMEEHIPSKKDLFSNQPVCKNKLKLRRCVSDLPSNQEKFQQSSKPKLKKYTSADIVDQSQSQEESNKKGAVTGSETSRREKSLGLLCEKFLDHFPMEVSCLETPRRLIIDDVASVLGTERRRVYDIVNILECLNMASRVQKNMYQWMGKQHLENTLSKLKGLAEDWGISAHTTEPVETSLCNLKSGRVLSPNSLGENIPDSRKEKSIGILCQKFLMLFLTSDPPHIVQLETANHLLLGQEGDDIDKIRKRGRRIYDIANVLVALRLITKLPQCKSFKYIGPSVYAIKSEVSVANLNNKIKNRHSLLPPPILELVRENSSLHSSVDSEVTPENILNNLLKNGRTARKTGTAFPHSKAKRNCLIARTKNIETSVHQASVTVKKTPSVEYVCKSGFEDIQSAQYVNRENEKPRMVNNITRLNERPNMTKIFRFNHYGSPRMALTFSDNSNILRSPPTITDRLPLPEDCISKVIVRPPFILRKVSVPSVVVRPASPLTVAPQTTESSLVKQMHTVRTSNTLNVDHEKKAPVVKSVGIKSFRVYTSGNRSTFSPASDNTMQVIASPVPVHPKCDSNQPKFFTKSLSQNVLPNINLNTLSKSHYKIGTSSPITSPTFSATSSNGSFRFIINSKNNHIAKTQSDPGKEMKEPSFIKMLDNSPDQSSTDSELENIFGDSFKFTRPKSLVKKS